MTLLLPRIATDLTRWVAVVLATAGLAWAGVHAGRTAVRVGVWIHERAGGSR